VIWSRLATGDKVGGPDRRGQENWQEKECERERASDTLPCSQVLAPANFKIKSRVQSGAAGVCRVEVHVRELPCAFDVEDGIPKSSIA